MDSPSALVPAITEVWTAMMNWIIESFTSVGMLFYQVDIGLTFIGVLTICGLGIGVILMLIFAVRDWMRFR